MRRIGIIIGVMWALLPFALRAESGGDSWAAKKAKVNALIIMRLTQELGLNAAQAAQIGDILKKYNERRHELRKQVKGLTAQLRAATESGNDNDIKKLLNETKQAKADLDQVDDKMFNDVKPMLSAKQQAQFLIAMDEIRSEIRAIKHREAAPGAVPGYPGAFTNNPNAFPGMGNPNDPGAVQKAVQPNP